MGRLGLFMWGLRRLRCSLVRMWAGSGGCKRGVQDFKG